MVVCPQRLRRDPGKEENLVIHPHRRTLMSRHVKLKPEPIASTTLLDLPCLCLWWPLSCQHAGCADHEVAQARPKRPRS